MPAIEFQNVVFAYGDRTILKNVNFVIEQGKFAPFWAVRAAVKPP